MTEKQFKVINISKNGMKGLFQLGNDNLSIYDVARLLNELLEENEKLKQQLKSIEDDFKFCCTENRIEFNKDEIKFKDTHTELALKDGKLYLTVFTPKINEYFKFFHWLLEED